MARLLTISICGFRAFGREEQTLELTAPVSVLLGPNSQGKTSLAEALEFLLTGTISRRALVASTADEFADALRNAHIPTTTDVYVSATVNSGGGTVHVVKRKLTEDFSKRSTCQSELTIDGVAAPESALTTLGIVLSQPPLAAPVLMQHTLSHLFSVSPQERAVYFKALLEVTDLDDVSAAAGTLDQTLIAAQPAVLRQLRSCPLIPPLTPSGSTLPDVAAAIADAAANVLLDAGEAPPADSAARIKRLVDLLAERRQGTFRMDIFNRQAPTAWSPPRDEVWNTIETFRQKLASVSEDTKRLTTLFSEVLRLPEVVDLKTAIDCPVCETPEALTPARVTAIRSLLEANTDFQRAMSQAQNATRELERSATTLVTSIAPALPSFVDASPEARAALGLNSTTLLPLIGETAQPLLNALESSLRGVQRARATLTEAANQLRGRIRPLLSDIRSTVDLATIKTAYEPVQQARTALLTSLESYAAAESQLRDALRTSVDRVVNTAGWEDLIQLHAAADSIREALATETAAEATRKELAQALRAIDRAKEQILVERFGALSGDIAYWWEILRPDGSTFFESLKPRRGAKRTIDFKAGLAVSTDRANPKLRDVIAVFSQSQLHCLGLAAFLARTVREGAPFIVLDDPILSSDDDHRLFFTAQAVNELLARGIQVLVLTQDSRSADDLAERYAHIGIDVFHVALDDPARGALVLKTSDEVLARLQRGHVFTRSGLPDLRKRAAAEFRQAAERICKIIAVNGRRAAGDTSAALSDYDGKVLGALVPEAVPYLTDPAEPGKLRAIGKALNPGTHDSIVPSSGDLAVCHGDLQAFRRAYCKQGTP